MKTNFLKAFAIFALFIANSCSNDDNNPNNPSVNGLIPKTIVEKNASGTVTNTFTFTYDGNKMIEASNTAKIDGVASVKFTYNGDKVTKYEYVRPQSSGPNDYVTIEYNSSGKPSKVAGSTYVNAGYTYGDYTYNSDGTVTVTRPNGSSKLTYNGSNLLKIETIYNSTTTISEFEYDTTKNNAFKNVSGLDFARNFGYVSGFYHLPGNAFATKSTGTFGWATNPNTYTATYNSDNLPTKVTDASGKTFEITY